MTYFKNLIVWQKSLNLAQSIYHLTEHFPKVQRFSLSNQTQRAAVSIMSNIAEGSKRTSAEWIHFTRISLGSAAELESQLLLSKSLNFGNLDQYSDILDELKTISKILQSISSKN